MQVSKETITKTIGMRLRQYRQNLKISQEELAYSSEIHPAYLGRVERGEKCPTIETLYKISNGLKVPLNELLDLSLEMTVPHNNAFYRIESALKNLSDEQMDKIADIVEIASKFAKNQI